MKAFYRIPACIFFFIHCMHVNGQSNSAHEFKMTGGSLIVYDFYLSAGDTVYEKYEQKKMVKEQNDSVLYVELYNNRKDWFLYRYLLQNNKAFLSGWQQEFDLGGNLINEQYCEFGKRHCDILKKYNYYPGGRISSVVSYLKNELHGYTSFYYSNGQLRQTIEYKEGRIWNMLVYYDQEGNILDAGNFKNGDGTLNVYSMNGIMIQQKIYSKGKLKKKINITGQDEIQN